MGVPMAAPDNEVMRFPQSVHVQLLFVRRGTWRNRDRILRGPPDADGALLSVLDDERASSSSQVRHEIPPVDETTAFLHPATKSHLTGPLEAGHGERDRDSQRPNDAHEHEDRQPDEESEREKDYPHALQPPTRRGLLQVHPALHDFKAPGRHQSWLAA